MSTVNVMAKEISAKVVFYGPGLSGKTTTLRRIYESIKPSLRGELMSLPTEADRTLFFDFLPVRVERVGDYAVRLALYTVPGQVFYNATRKLVLQGADGVVFVADSNPAAADSNSESLANLEENLAEQGIRLEQFPHVMQYNKRDIANAQSLAVMRAELNSRGVPDFETCATNGQGVLDAMKSLIRLVIKDLQSKRVVPSTPRAKPTVPTLARDEGADLAAQIQQHLGSPTPVPAMAPVSRSSGFASALAPAALIDPARAAEAAFQMGDYARAVVVAHETVRRGLSYAGEGAAGAFLLGLDGRDVLTLETASARGGARVDDAAFALYVMTQLFVRLAAAGLPTPSH
jgi:mutual gliding-motility protein MglA